MAQVYLTIYTRLFYRLYFGTNRIQTTVQSSEIQLFIIIDLDLGDLPLHVIENEFHDELFVLQ